MRYDSSFASFINPTETQGDICYEVIFYNEALTNISSSSSVKDVDTFVEKAVFRNEEIKNPISLQGVAQNRYSNVVLSQVYRLVHQIEMDKKSETEGKLHQHK